MPSHRKPSARHEVRTKSPRRIDRETANTWAARAAAAYIECAEGGGVRWLLRAADYESEALEHAARAQDGGKTLRRVTKKIKKAKDKCPLARKA